MESEQQRKIRSLRSQAVSDWHLKPEDGRWLISLVERQSEQITNLEQQVREFQSLLGAK